MYFFHASVAWPDCRLYKSLGTLQPRAVVRQPTRRLLPQYPVASMLTRAREARTASATVLSVAPCHA
eukprot:1090585-Rhodomonas_salina.1